MNFQHREFTQDTNKGIFVWYSGNIPPRWHQMLSGHPGCETIIQRGEASLLRLNFSQGFAPRSSYFYRAASLTNLNNCSCHSVPLGLLDYELGSLTVIHWLWLFLKLGRVSLRIVPSGRTMVYVAKGLFTLGSFIGLIGTQTPMYRLKKIGLNGSLQHLCKLIWFSYNTSYQDNVTLIQMK